MWPNLAGVFTGLGCTCIYHIYSFDNHLKVYFVSFVLIGLSLKFATTLDTTSIGIEGCVLATVLMGSPLATIGTVLKERSTAALPLYPSLFTWCNAASWSLYGILISKDVMIWSPNVAGLILATVQMFMFVLFGLPPTNRKKTGSTFPGVWGQMRYQCSVYNIWQCHRMVYYILRLPHLVSRQPSVDGPFTCVCEVWGPLQNSTTSNCNGTPRYGMYWIAKRSWRCGCQLLLLVRKLI